MKRFTVFYVCLLFFFSLSAQQNLMVSIPYSMGFEATGNDSTELADGLWVLNAGAQAAQCNDQWMTGTAVHSDGRQSLYIVGDTTLNPTYGNAANLQFAYRDFQFPVGSYTLTFDWLNAGGANTALYVGFVSYNPSIQMGAYTYVTANATSGAMPDVLTKNNCSGALYGQDTWQSYTFSKNINVSAGSTSVYRVYVAWSNKGGAADAGTAIGGCVDNIQIVDARAPRPSNIQIRSIACDTVELSWTGVADSYTVQYRKVGTNTWMNATYDASTPKKALVEGLAEGSYMFRVRGESMDTQGNTLYSAYTYAEEEYLVYCEDRHCLAYFNLEGPNVVCTTGDFDDEQLSAAFDNVGIVDFGAESVKSRHTVNWDKTATDPRTGDRLRVVPSNVMASVRLGNWDTGAECEGITYSIVVDSAYSILLLQYAIVMEDPDHDDASQPRFTLEITDEQGNKIDPTCGDINFAADANRPGWYTEGEGYNKVTWKDWSTVGLNLSDYVGQTIQVRLATYDCSWSGHFGYAYFTLDCAGATISSTSCGDNTHMHVSAPDGFNYIWTDSHGNVVSREQNADIVIINAEEYTCELISKEKSNCSFELSVKALPKFPIADGRWTHEPKDCKNIVRFQSESFIRTFENDIPQDHYDEPLGGILWDFGDGAQSSQPVVTHTFPTQGGSFDVSLAAWLGDGTGDCYKDTVFHVELPALKDTTIENTINICSGELYNFHGRTLTETGIYTFDSLDYAGCDMHFVTDLTVHPKQEIVLPDTVICDYDTLWIGDQYYASRKDGIFRPVFQNQYGCDSMIIVNVRYADPVLPTMQVEQMSDSVLEATIVFGGTGYTYYIINGDMSNPQTSSVIKTDEAMDYVFDFYNEYGCTEQLRTSILPPCLRDVVFQRWNDILSLKNSEYNGGTQFFGYQWYKDEEKIEGATKSYYYAPDGLEMGAHYYCEVLLADSTWSKTCNWTAVDQVNAPAGVSVSPTMVSTGASIRVIVPTDATLTCHNMMGMLLQTEQLNEGENTMRINMEAGTYILRITTPDGEMPFRLQVK